MKKVNLLLAMALFLAAFVLVSCGLRNEPNWDPTLNPLDSPVPSSDLIEPLADHGVFGPNWEAKRFHSSY